MCHLLWALVLGTLPMPVATGWGESHDSLTRAFQAYNDAAAKPDIKALAAQMTRDSQAVLAATMMVEVVHLRRLESRKERTTQALDALLKRHGLGEKAIFEKATAKAKNNKAEAQAAVAMGNLVADKLAFISDTYQVMRKLTGGKEEKLQPFGVGKLQNFKIEGDTARGKVTSTGHGAEKTTTIHFRMEDGSWKIDWIPELEEKGAKAFMN